MIYSGKDSKGIPLQTKLDKIFNKKKGFFIELGANNGLTQSNTAFFEKELEWSGILIEPSLKGFQECKKNRPNSICLNYACVSNDYQSDYIEGDFKNNSLMGSVNGTRLENGKIRAVNNDNTLTTIEKNKKIQQLMCASKRKGNFVKVKAITLEKILDQHCHTNIDFLSLDTEGYEFEILKGLNLMKYRPNYLLIEIYTKDFDDIKNFLNSQNYKLHSNFTNYNLKDNNGWDESHNDYLFMDNTLKESSII